MKRSKGFSLLEMMVVIVILAMLATIFTPTGVHAWSQHNSVVVSDVSTFTVTGDDYVWDANSLVISSQVPVSLIKEIDISIENPAEAPQTITFWDGWSLNQSSANVTKIWEVHIPSTTVDKSEISYQKTFDQRFQLKATRGLGVTKTSTGNQVHLSIQYE